MDEQTSFALAVSQNKYLSTEDDEMHAIVTVTAHGYADAPHGHMFTAAEVIAVDCSDSMSRPPTKIAAACHATEAAIDALRDGVFFAVIEGTHTARMVYPAEQRLVAATEETRNAAKTCVRRLIASGATAIGTWLRLAERLLAEHPAAVRHVILLTDGQNLPEYEEDLNEALAMCEGRFVCDGRGIGDDYDPEELLRIVSTLRGSADAILDDSDLASEFTDMMRESMSKVVPDVLLQIRTTPFSRLKFVKQKFPTEVDLSKLGVEADALTRTFSTGSWSEGEQREFHVCLAVDRIKDDTHGDIQAARVDLMVMRAGSGQAEMIGEPEAIRVHRTENARLSSVLDPKVAHYAYHEQLGNAVQAGWDAYRAADPRAAAKRWGRAVALAAELGHEELLKRLCRLVDVVGRPSDGVVRVKDNLLPRHIFSVVLGSATSTPSPEAAPPPVESRSATGSIKTCDRCGNESPSEFNFCMKCGRALGEATP